MQNREILGSIRLLMSLRTLEIGPLRQLRQLGQLSVFWGGITTRRITLLLLSDKIKKGVITKNMLVSRLSDAYSVDVTTGGVSKLIFNPSGTTCHLP